MRYEGSRGVGMRRTRGQRGSALLIVFVFAAMIAIALYAEMPIAVFEAKREKEQLLIDRGNEYAHAVKLFVRKFGMYPATVDQLENTNRMRFLRHRFKDPFTGKDDWRMLHAGPGGQLVDSKVKPAGLGNLPGSGPGSNSSSSFGSTNTESSFGSTNTGSTFGATGSASTASSSGFGQSGFGSSSSGNSGDTVVVPDLPQRPPAISANGGAPGGSSEAGASTEGGQNASSVPTDDLREQMTAVEQAQPALPTENAGQTAGSEPAGAGSGQNGVGQAGASGNQVRPNQAGQNGGSGQAGANGPPDAQNAMDTVRKMLNNPAIGAPLAGSSAGNGQGQPGMGQISGGSIAGVASKAHGHSIKTVNDQTDYSLWEFYYDPTKDLTRNMPGAQGAQGNGQVGAGTNGINTGASPNANGQSAFGQSSFGQNSSGQSSFGQNSGNTNSSGPTASPTNPPQ